MIMPANLHQKIGLVKALMFIFFMLFGIISSTAAYAEEPISLKTFGEFSKVAGFERQYNQMVTIFASNFQKGMITGFQNAVNEEELPDHVKEKLFPIINQSAENLRVNFEKLFESLIQFEDLVENVYFPVYQKVFSENEILEVVVFYKSPVGKKLSQFSPLLMQESSEVFNNLYGARVQRLGGELVEKEMDILKSKFRELKDTVKKP